jgi:hypothetical protein
MIIKAFPHNPPAVLQLTSTSVIASPKGAAICSDRRVALLLAMTGSVNSMIIGMVADEHERRMSRS